ncbi:Phosphoinositide-3-kinase-interacting protein 1 [Heterocephalus glaber]|uniref:Phosphoinositide-3-kinase-interacting protein 1 n=1 Tax=Heterocephalus glaber TaxID=10181 RepID=G5BBU8_HETGA|nr:phosphoinositide-3-kinase-interacting protein 1 isoform X2 [Heterocephalus glaber]EHB06759.1 Phosphoinositide-3-kinase-interacting protein 1 [Heterocephalus glaber]
MLLAWVQTFFLSNMLLAEAYGSGGCFWDHGHLYREDQPSPAPGLRCLNWLDAQGGLGSALELGYGNHNYCRNPDRDPRGPWCYVSGEAGTPEKVPCQDARCPETTSQAPPAFTTEPEEMSEVPGDDEVQVFAPANTLPVRSEAAAVQPVIGISQRVRMNSKEKKDLGTLGYVLGITMMVIIIAIGAGIILGYTYKRGKDLKEQHDQKVCEREMQRITLPLSAFTNPTCEIVDERTVVVHSNQTPVDLQEGSTPLIGEAGTPGA